MDFSPASTQADSPSSLTESEWKEAMKILAIATGEFLGLRPSQLYYYYLFNDPKYKVVHLLLAVWLFLIKLRASREIAKILK